MKNPLYAKIMFAIEQIICLSDNEAEERGVTLTDSQVRSALIKARKRILGEDPTVPGETDRDQVLAGLITKVEDVTTNLVAEVELPDGTAEERPLDPTLWANSLEAVEDSIKTRRVGGSGSRAYLSFIHGFVRDAGG
jgi:hypothetical protein